MMQKIESRSRFSWGRVIEDYEIGPYTIRAFHPHQVEGSTVLRTIDETRINYHGYIYGKDCNESWPTLEDAMVGLIVRGMIGPNSTAINYHFMAGVRAISAAHPPQ